MTAREIFIISPGKKPTENITTYQHCRAEFLPPGYGWGTSDARKAMLAAKLELKDAQTKH
jgi:transglutaminase-like putative cysteine protease